MTRPQKNANTAPVFGSSLVMDGYLVLMEVWPLKRAASVQARQNPRMARDMMTRPQKNANTAPVFGSSLVMMGFPEMAERMFWIKYEACMMPENSTTMVVYRVKRAKYLLMVSIMQCDALTC